MEKILKKMQQIGDVDLKPNFKAIAWFLTYYGYYCVEVADFQKSIKLQEQPISLMESTFGDDANHHYVLGYSYSNLDIVYHKSKKLVEAKQCCETALKIYN